jgi:hypothetical protein
LKVFGSRNAAGLNVVYLNLKFPFLKSTNIL